MNKKNLFIFFNLFLSGFLLMILPACLKTYELVPSESSQGKVFKDDNSVERENLRTVRVYDEWETEALFDVLWMSDQTRRAYVDLYTSRRGSTKEETSKKLEEELEKNKNEMSFYVLADIRDAFHPKLTDKNPAWTIYLETDDGDRKMRVSPKSIKELDPGAENLGPEILTIFGYRYTKPKFKTPYLVKFDTKNIFMPGAPEKMSEFRMVIRSTTRQCTLGWLGGDKTIVKDLRDKKEKRKFIKDEDYYWI